MAQKLIRRKSATRTRWASNNGLSAKVAEVEKTVANVKLPNFKPGDEVKVFVKIIEGGKERLQAYEGIVMARQNRGNGRSYTVRKMSHGVGVERVFLESSPKVAKVEVLTPGTVRRAKLYYLRKLAGKKAKIDQDIGRVDEQASATQA